MKWIVSVVLMCSAVSADVFGQERISLAESDGFVQALGGSNFSTSLGGFSFGFAAGYRAIKKYPNISLGLVFQSEPVRSINSTVSDSFTGYGALIYYHFKEENEGLIVGLRSGYFTRLLFRGVYVEPVVQYHFPLFDFLTVGLELGANMQFKQFGLPSFLAVSGNGVIQYWF